jgi:hypothetical protein
MPKEYTENATDKTMKETIYAIQEIEQAVKGLQQIEKDFQFKATLAVRSAKEKKISIMENTRNFGTAIIANAVSKDVISVHDASELVRNITKSADNILKTVHTAEPLHKKLIEQRNKLSEQNQIDALNTLNNELEDVQEKAKAKAYASVESTKKITTAINLIMSGYEKHITARKNLVEPGAPIGGRRKQQKRKTHRKQSKRR